MRVRTACGMRTCAAIIAAILAVSSAFLRSASSRLASASAALRSASSRLARSSATSRSSLRSRSRATWLPPPPSMPPPASAEPMEPPPVLAGDAMGCARWRKVQDQKRKGEVKTLRSAPKPNLPPCSTSAAAAQQHCQVITHARASRRATRRLRRRPCKCRWCE